MYNPKVSIVMPVYNGANYMREAIDSALSQTYKNIEIIVINDGSPDDGETEKIALSYGDKIRYIYKENGGSSSALNIGIKNMTGDYFSWLSHDDLYTPDHIEKMVAHIDEKIKDKQVIVCGMSLIDENGNPIFYPVKRLNGKMSHVDMMKNFRNGMGINGCCIIIPKKIIDESGYFDESLTYVNDGDYWHRLVLNGCVFTCFDEQLTKARIHKNQVSVKKAELCDIENSKLMQDVIDKLLSLPDADDELYSVFLQKVAFAGRMKLVKSALKKKKVSLLQKSAIIYYYIKGGLIRSIKRIYHKLFFRR